MNFEKQMKIQELTESFHSKEFKVTDVIHNDLYRHMSNAGLFDYDYIERGQISSKGTKRKASKTNMVFLVWLMIARDLKEFGVVNAKLHIVKNYLFEDAKDMEISNLFSNIYKLLTVKNKIILSVKANGEAMFINELELSNNEIKELSCVKSIVLPLKNYIIELISEYATTEFLIRSRILNNNEAVLLDEFKIGGIKSISIKYKKGQSVFMEITKATRIEMLNRLSETFIISRYEDIIINTEERNIVYSELTKKTKL